MNKHTTCAKVSEFFKVKKVKKKKKKVVVHLYAINKHIQVFVKSQNSVGISHFHVIKFLISVLKRK